MEQLIDNMKRKRTHLPSFIEENILFFRAYNLFKQAASAGHIGAKEELAFGHLMGVHLPMDFNRAKAYFEEGVGTGSPQSHYVKLDI